MSSRTTKLIIALFVLLVLGAGVFLWMTSSEELGNGPTAVPAPEDPIELRDDEVDLPDYPEADSLNPNAPKD